MVATCHRPAVCLTVKDLAYWVPDGNKGQRSILKGISASFKSGQLTAILGPSGSGKTTFMDIAAGCRSKRVSGSVLVNGRPRDLAAFRRHSCYITQMDHLVPFLTVLESMKVAAALKLEREARGHQDKLIEDILRRLRLTECSNTRVHDLSGGETKRLSIALELVNNPPVMFFDEPTSGLDSRNSYECIQVLKSLAVGGRTIVCTIHQPSARLFQMFDQVVALSDGQCIFRGTTHEVLPFLDSMGLQCPPYHNPADFLVEVAVGEYGDLGGRLAAETGCKKLLLTAHNQSLDVVPDEDRVLSRNTSLNRTSSNCDRNRNKSFASINSKPDAFTVTVDGGEQILNSTRESVCVEHCEVDTDHMNITNIEIELNNVGESVGNCIYTKEDINGTVLPASESLLDNVDTNVNRKLNFPTSTWIQFTVLLNRTFLTIIRDMMLTKLRLGAHIAVSLLIGLLYYDVGKDASKVVDNTGCLFFMVLFFLFTAMMPTILTFPLEMQVLLREHLNRWYSLKAYYLAKTVADLPFQVLFPVLSVLIVYYMTAQPMECWRLLLFTFFAILTSLVAQSIGLTIGAALSVQEAVFLGPATVMPMLLFSGFFITFSTIPGYMRWLTYLSFIRYGFEGIVLSIYGFNRPNLDCSQPFCYYKSPAKFLRSMDITESNIYLDVGALVLYFVVVRIMGYFVLRWKVTRNR